MTLQEQEPLPPAVNRLKQQVQKWRQAKEGQFSWPNGVSFGCLLTAALELRGHPGWAWSGGIAGPVKGRGCSVMGRIMLVHRTDTFDPSLHVCW